MLPNRSRPFPARENLVLSDMWSITEKESDLNGIEFNVRLWNSLQQCKWYLKCKSTAKSLLQLKVVRFVSLGDWILTFFYSNVKVIDLGKFSPNTRRLLLPGGFPEWSFFLSVAKVWHELVPCSTQPCTISLGNKCVFATGANVVWNPRAKAVLLVRGFLHPSNSWRGVIKWGGEMRVKGCCEASPRPRGVQVYSTAAGE